MKKKKIFIMVVVGHFILAQCVNMEHPAVSFCNSVYTLHFALSVLLCTFGCLQNTWWIMRPLIEESE